MSLFEKIFLKDVQSFQKFTAEEKKRVLKLFKHKYVAVWLAYILMHSVIPSVIFLALCVINLIICDAYEGILIDLLFIITIITITVVTSILIIIKYRSIIKGQTEKEIERWITDKIRNLWLLNGKVISFKDWKIIKKRCRDLYEKARSEECNHKCYFISYALANTLENPDIKILWICIQTTSKNKCGHSVLAKNGKIYDSNMRRTYNRQEYLEAFQAEIFKEYSIEEYLNQINLKKPYFNFLDWEEFGEWCKVRDAVRNG